MNSQILVVDDEPMMLPFIATVLRKSGYGVWQATSPKEALNMVGNGLPPMDLLLADVFMPKMTGPQLSERMTEFYPHMKSVFMTGLNEDYLRAIGIEVPGEAVLKKPFNANELLSMVLITMDMPIGMGHAHAAASD